MFKDKKDFTEYVGELGLGCLIFVCFIVLFEYGLKEVGKLISN